MRGLGQKIPCCFPNGDHERGETKKKKRTPSLSLRSTEFRQSDFVGLRLKVHLLDERSAWVKKMRGFTKDLSEEFSRNQRFRAREASHSCNHASRARDSSYLSLFFTFWAEKCEFRVSARSSFPRRRHVSSLLILTFNLSESVVRPGKPKSRLCAEFVRLGE